MLSDGLIRVIERHAEELTSGAVEKLVSSSHTRSYHRLSPDRLFLWLFGGNGGGEQWGGNGVSGRVVRLICSLNRVQVAAPQVPPAPIACR
jgi:hypothetical protein